jgi:hypothetical protein
MTDLEVLEFIRGAAQMVSDQLADACDEHERRELREAHHTFVEAAALFEQCLLDTMLRAPSREPSS